MCALRSPQPAAKDAGVTIVEMLAAVFVLGLGVMGIAALLVTSARTAAIAESQRDASALATGEIEIIRSLDYERIGIDPSSDGYRSSVEDRPTVTERTDNVIRASDRVEIDNTVFGIERSVTWAAVGDNTQAYKIVQVVVSWETSAGKRSLTVQTGLHEGLFGG